MPPSASPTSRNAATKAGLYDPAGVGGTHVMYVLHRRQTGSVLRPAGQPSISRPVALWKGATKPLATLALAGCRSGQPVPLCDERSNEVSKEIERVEGGCTMIRRSKDLKRYDASERTNHWVVGISFILLALSGLALFTPAFFPPHAAVRQGTARILHPCTSVSSWPSSSCADVPAFQAPEQDDRCRSRVAGVPGK